SLRRKLSAVLPGSGLLSFALSRRRTVGNVSLPSKSPMTAAIGHGQRIVDQPQSKGQISVAITSVSCITPSGGCGRLPSGMVARLSGATGTCSPSLNGNSVTLTWNAGMSMWSGTTTIGILIFGIQLTCLTGSWHVVIAGGYTGTGTATGTSGPEPNLTSTIS